RTEARAPKCRRVHTGGNGTSRRRPLLVAATRAAEVLLVVDVGRHRRRSQRSRIFGPNRAALPGVVHRSSPKEAHPALEPAMLAAAPAAVDRRRVAGRATS